MNQITFTIAASFNLFMTTPFSLILTDIGETRNSFSTNEKACAA